jgi:hypothetical protein
MQGDGMQGDGMQTVVTAWRLIHIMLILLVLAGCSLLPVPPVVIQQGQGLPALRHLDWSFSAIHHPV